MQFTNKILMIKPVQFGYNEQTAKNNFFQKKIHLNNSEIQRKALIEFNNMVDILSSNGINIKIIEDTFEPITPDSIFPNNWVSFHDNMIILYPMFAENRRKERRNDIIENIINIENKEIKDYSNFENENIFLEGTGSIILDRENKIAYASISERTNKELFLQFCLDNDYKPIIFHSFQTFKNKRLPIYHTNVMMCVADNYAIICLDSIDKEDEKKIVIKTLEKTKKEIITISEDQMQQFAGNMLQLYGKQKYLIMSETAYKSLSREQINKIERYNQILAIPIPTIEKIGGGSVRCMMAEIY